MEAYRLDISSQFSSKEGVWGLGMTGVNWWNIMAFVEAIKEFSKQE